MLWLGHELRLSLLLAYSHVWLYPYIHRDRQCAAVWEIQFAVPLLLIQDSVFLSFTCVSGNHCIPQHSSVLSSSSLTQSYSEKVAAPLFLDISMMILNIMHVNLVFLTSLSQVNSFCLCCTALPCIQNEQQTHGFHSLSIIEDLLLFSNSSYCETENLGCVVYDNKKGCQMGLAKKNPKTHPKASTPP